MGATALFAALAREPRVYVDTIELSTVRLRLTLALAGKAELGASSGALLELLAPLAQLSDVSLCVGAFAARHALLTTAQLKAALVAHCQRELLLHLLTGALGAGTTQRSSSSQDLVELCQQHARGLERIAPELVFSAPAGLLGAASAAIGDRLATAHALLAGDAAYFCERAKRHRERRFRSHSKKKPPRVFFFFISF